MYPKMKELNPYISDPNPRPIYPNPIPINGQIINTIRVIGNKAAKVTIGTNLTPLKNPITAGNWMSLNLLYNHATVKPTMNPPNTDVDSCVIPSTDPTTDLGKPYPSEIDPNEPS